MSLLFFLFRVFVISLSGAMAPGPVTAAAIAMGARWRYAGTFIAIGHAIIELPLVFLIIMGIEHILKSNFTQTVIGLAGGTFLIIMAGTMICNLRTTDPQKSRNINNQQTKPIKTGPVATGIILSAGNPYFLLWWATIGLALATTASGWGLWVFVLFIIVHWLCDFVWLSMLSWASFKGSAIFGSSSQNIILWICSLALFIFGLFFIYNAVTIFINLIST